MADDVVHDDIHLQVQQVVQELLEFRRQWRVQSRGIRNTYGLSARKVAVLRRLVSDGPMTVGQIAAHFCISCPTASEIIDGLGTLDYVRGYRGSQDGRRRWIEATPQGCAVAEMAPLTPVERIRLYLDQQDMAALQNIHKVIADITNVIASQERDSS